MFNINLYTHWREISSSVCGCISLASWIVLLLPQLIEQWKYESSEGISFLFLFIWFIGDVTNLIGALWANLLPDVIALAIWFCLADILMLTSTLYYYNKSKNSPSSSHIIVDYQRDLERNNYPEDLDSSSIQEQQIHSSVSNSTTIEENTNDTSPLLSRSDENSSYNNYNNNSNSDNFKNQKQRRSSAYSKKNSLRRKSLPSNSTTLSFNYIFWQYILPVLFIISAGIFGFFISKNDNNNKDDNNDSPGETPLGAEIFGYISSILYLGARIPQIYKNYKKKSVRGLSLLFFIFSTIGNITYGAQILFYSTDSNYILKNLPWLLGSLGTILEDCIVSIEIFLFSNYSFFSIYDILTYRYLLNFIIIHLDL